MDKFNILYRRVAIPQQTCVWKFNPICFYPGFFPAAANPFWLKYVVPAPKPAENSGICTNAISIKRRNDTEFPGIKIVNDGVLLLTKVRNGEKVPDFLPYLLRILDSKAEQHIQYNPKQKQSKKAINFKRFLAFLKKENITTMLREQKKEITGRFTISQIQTNTNTIRLKRI